jgi:outer membrane protein assembly factor BamB
MDPEKERQMRYARITPKSRARYFWSVNAPLIARAMVLSSDKLVLGGASLDDADELTVLENLNTIKTGELVILSANNGSERFRMPLDGVPVLDGMIVANGKVFISTQNGKVVCLGES